MGVTRAAQKKTLQTVPVRSAPAEAARTFAPGTDTTAIILCHGMGQQVPFQTLNSVAEALILAEEEVSGQRVSPQVTLLPDPPRYLARAELTVKNKSIHLYEVYWAPITEGQVRMIDVIKFLLQAGWAGLTTFEFKRFLYSKWRTLPIGHATKPLIVLILMFIVSLGLHFLAFALFATNHFLDTIGWGLLNRTATVRSAANMTFVLFTLLSLAAVWAILWALRRVTPPARGEPSWTAKFAMMAKLVLTTVVLFVPFGMGALLFVGLLPVWRWQVSSFLLDPSSRILLSLLLVGWAFAFWSALQTVTQYVGDVAAYISAHKLSKFFKVREEIQATALHVAEAVYSQTKYTEVLIVGHSLGSVVAYDTFNAVVRAARITHGNAAARALAKRTKRLITFGSPLDKTAFLFRQHMKEEGLGVREALAAEVQPLIHDAAFWPVQWINIYSPADIISGSLDYYDDPLSGRAVRNIIDWDADWPLLAHNQYWENSLLRKTLYDSI